MNNEQLAYIRFLIGAKAHIFLKMVHDLTEKPVKKVMAIHTYSQI